MLLTNISRLVTMEVAKDRRGHLGVIEDVCVRISGDRISWIGSCADLEKISGEEAVDCSGCVVMPGLVECHTHLVYAGSREDELRMRSLGATYGEIAQAGGGILSTVRATRAADEEGLLALAMTRADEAVSRGITTIEIKSGYGLDLETEEKILRVAKRLGEEHAIGVVPTFLGAHVVPEEYRDRRADYVKLVTDEMLPRMAGAGLCRFCDVFVEECAFTPDEARAIAAKAKQLGLRMRLHIDQFTDGGGGALAAELGAISADHLDYVSDDGVMAMAAAGVTAVLLPTATLFTGGTHYAPARRLIKGGVKVAISTDFNPGTSPTLDLMMAATLGVTQMGMTTDEALMGITINAARSLGMADEIGSIAPGKRADLAIFEAPNEGYLLYRFGTNLIRMVIKDGVIVGAGV